MDIFDQIAAGVRPQPPESNYTGKAPPSMEEQRLGYVLAKQIPAMARGFCISTGYGDIVVLPGPLADQLQALVREATERKLAALGAQA